MALRVSDYQIRRFAARGNEEDGPDSRARGDRFYRNRRSADRGNEKVNRDPGNIYNFSPVYDEYEDEDWYYGMTGAGAKWLNEEVDGESGDVKKKSVRNSGAKKMARNEGNIFTFDDIEINEGEKGLVDLVDGSIHASDEFFYMDLSQEGVDLYMQQSTIINFYPTDLHGKRLAGKSIAKLSFIDKTRLCVEGEKVEKTLTVEEKTDAKIRGINYIFDPGRLFFLKLSKLEDEFF